MTEENPLLVEDRGNVRWIILNRPEAMNAITPEMLSRLNDELKAADDAGDVRGRCTDAVPGVPSAPDWI